MRHGKKINHLGRKKEHREAMLSNMATSLIMHKRIFTTTAKAKALRKYVEPLITKSKTDTTHSRRMIFSYLQSKDAVVELFSNVADKVGDRPGGYTRILKTGNRLGDNADMCMMELVDFNELMLEEKATRSGKKGSAAKRTRRGKKGAVATTVATESTADTAEEVVAEAETTEEVATEAETAEEVVAEAEATEEVETQPEVAEEAAPEAETTDTPEASDEKEKGETGDQEEEKKD